jgi:hypothetical protein
MNGKEEIIWKEKVAVRGLSKDIKQNEKHMRMR